MNDSTSFKPSVSIRLCLLALLFIPLIIRLSTYTFSGTPNVSIPLHCANWVIVLHIMLGAYVMMKHLVIRMTVPHLLVNAVLTCLLYGVVWIEMNITIWAALYALLFSCAIIKYVMVLNNLPGIREKRYVLVKIKNEWPVIPLFALLSALAWLFPEHSAVQSIIEFVPLLLAIAFFIWLAFVKRAYHWVFEDATS